jgi:hypothetical protein
MVIRALFPVNVMLPVTALPTRPLIRPANVTAPARVAPSAKVTPPDSTSIGSATAKFSDINIHPPDVTVVFPAVLPKAPMLETRSIPGPITTVEPA